MRLGAMAFGRPHKGWASVWLLVALASSCVMTPSSGALRSTPFNTTLMEDPLEPIWNRLDNLSNDILQKFQALMTDILQNTNTKLEEQLQKLSADVNVKFDNVNNDVMRALAHVRTSSTQVDQNFTVWMQHYYNTVMRPDAEAATNRITVSLSALENKILEHINTKFSALTSFNITLPHHTPPASSSSSSSSTTSTTSSSTTALTAEDTQALINQLNAKLMALDTKLEDLSTKVDTATSTLSTINMHVNKINEREMDAEGEPQEPGVVSGETTEGGAEGGSSSCDALVQKVSTLVKSTMVSMGVINELEGRLEEMKQIPSMLPRDCSDIHWYNHDSPSGVYQIYPTLDIKSSVSAYCDMADQGAREVGGWTVILRRQNTTFGLIDFNRTWDDYIQGFGDPAEGEWWFSLSALHALTYRQPYEVRFLVRDIEYGYYTALYNSFRVEDESRLFRLNVDGFSGNITTDAFRSTHHGRPFTTWDRDNDNWDKGSCAVNNGGGWWFNACHYTTLTAPFPTSTDRDAKTIRWRTEERWLVLDDVTVEVRPVNYAVRFDVDDGNE